MLRTAPPSLAQIQAPVHDRLDEVVEEIRRMITADFEPIEEIGDYLLGIRGKLFRPSLLLLCNEIGDEPSPHAATLGAVVELIHLATLVHDDAVDHSVLRRGMPTINAAWSHQVAIIMGDYLYSRSLSELAQLRNVEMIGILAAASNAMSVGEMRQLASCEALDFGEEDYFQLIASKTASLMGAACELGALAGRPEHRVPLARYGRELGMAFQIADDLLDYTADQAVTGKPSGLDLREHKVTLPLIAVLSSLSAPERSDLEEFFRDPDPRDDSIAEVIGLVRSHGGLDYARQTAVAYAERAADALDSLPTSPALDALRDGIAYAVERQR